MKTNYNYVFLSPSEIVSMAAHQSPEDRAAVLRALNRDPERLLYMVALDPARPNDIVVYHPDAFAPFVDMTPSEYEAHNEVINKAFSSNSVVSMPEEYQVGLHRRHTEQGIRQRENWASIIEPLCK